MRVDAKLIVQPFATNEGHSVGERLQQELTSGTWDRFQAAVAFGRETGCFDEILDALEHFCMEGGHVALTFGADRFGENNFSTDQGAVQTVLDRLGGFDEAHIYLYSESGRRTFHPKLYLFSNESEALLIVGSSNWSEGGFFTNVEANVAMRFDLTDDENLAGYEELCTYFREFWQE